MTEWTQREAVALCTLIEAKAPEFGAHVGLTGGLLYKTGPRKDADILVYRIRQADRIDTEGLFNALREIGVELVRDHGFVKKATYSGKGIDFLFPDQPVSDVGDVYPR